LAAIDPTPLSTPRRCRANPAQAAFDPTESVSFLQIPQWLAFSGFSTSAADARRTPYRPTNTLLGSRRRLRIHIPNTQASRSSHCARPPRAAMNETEERFARL